MVSKGAFKVGFGLILIKILYIATTASMLPQNYLIWPFDKRVALNLIFFELIPFFVCLFIFMLAFQSSDLICFFSAMLFIVAFIPSNSTLSLSGYSINYYVLTQMYYILFFFALLVVSRKASVHTSNERFEIDSLYTNKRLLTVVRISMVIVCLLLITYVYLYNGLDFSGLFGNKDMYETRADYADYIAENTGGIISYLYIVINGLFGWLMPVFLYYSLISKKKLDIFLCIFTYAAYYTISMQKGILMIIPVILVIAYLHHNMSFSKITGTLTKMFVLLFLITILEYVIRGESFVYELIIRREFYIPSYMSEKYYSFFCGNTKEWFTQDAFLIQNILRGLLGSAYPSGATSLISQSYFQGLLPSPNTGFFAEAYSQCGALGALIFPFIYTYVVTKVRKIADWYGDGVVAILLVKLFLSMNNVFLLTSSSVIGIILFVIITWLLKYFSNRKTL